MQSRAKLYVTQKGWEFKESGVDQLAIQNCPLCGNENFKFYMNVSGEARDGLWDCKVCGEKGSLYQLKVKLGEANEGVASLKDAAMAGQTPDNLPCIPVVTKNLLENPQFEDVLDYLVAGRGFSVSVIESMKVGAEEYGGKKWVVIPYFDRKGNLIFAKYRSVPPADKEFRATQGREVPLYNAPIITDGMDELLFVEGETDALACLSMGISYVVGLPGANVKKAAWITRVDQAAPKKIYLLYDNDKVGQQAARDMAVRIGLEKCHNIVLPEFITEEGKPGKDINEWFRAGHTLAEFEELKARSKPFDVEGVASLPAVIQEIVDDIDQRGTQRAELDTPWKVLNERFGGANYGEVVGIIAEGKIGKTTMALNWLDYLSEAFSVPCLNFCLEMPQKNLVRKWICYKTRTDDEDLTREKVVEAMELARNMKGDILFGYRRCNRADDVFDLIRQAVRRYGVKVVVFDNLQFMVRSVEHTAQETAKYSKMFKELAMELNILVLLVVQPNRVREGEIVAARNSNGSSAIEKDVDAMIALHRNRQARIKADEFTGFMEADENFEPQLLVRTDLSRYAPGGVCTLLVEGAKSWIRELSDEEIQALKQPEKKATLEIEKEVKAGAADTDNI